MFRAQQLFEPRRGVLLGTGAHLGGGEPREIERCVQLPTRHVGGREAGGERREREAHWQLVSGVLLARKRAAAGPYGLRMRSWSTLAEVIGRGRDISTEVA